MGNIKDLIDEMDNLDNVVLPSAVASSATKNKDEEEESEWAAALEMFSAPKIKKNKKKSKIFDNELYDEITGEFKKKKKKKKGDSHDYQKDFAPELAILRGLLKEQDAFTDSLQRQYDTIEKQKGSSRGISKFSTDLIANINQARSTSLSILKEINSTKKTIHDLTMKERKDFGRKDEEGATDHAAESASFMRSLIKNRRDEIGVPEQTSNDIEISEVGSEESLLDDITPNPYVKFENKNITVYVKVDSNTGAYSFVAIDGDGNECDDYPLPSMSKLSVNPDTQTAIDPFGRKYPIMLD